MMPVIAMSDLAETAVRDAIGSRLARFDTQGAGELDVSRPLVLTLSDPDTTEILGGLWGATGWGYLHVDMLFVPENLRRSGIGRELMSKAEQEAYRRGCRSAWLDTFSFQARGFYERQGYVVFGSLGDYPTGHRRFFLTKTIPAPVQARLQQRLRS